MSDVKTPLRVLVEQIVDDLFENGFHEKADRLVLTVDSTPKRDLGGWCREAMADRIEEQLESGLEIINE